MKRFLLIFFCFFWCFSTLAQKEIVLEGKIIADSLSGTAINIVNLTQETGAVNSTSGEFEIKVKEGDILFFSSVQFEVREIEITSSIFRSGYLEVTLVEKITELEEVNISNINLTGNLKNDLSNIKVFSQAEVGIPFSDKPKLTSVERKLYSASSSSLGLLINTLNGNIKMLKKAKENQELSNLVERGMGAIDRNIFVEVFSIPEPEIVNFVYFCAEDPAFKRLVLRGEPLELIEYYKSKAAYFVANRMGR